MVLEISELAQGENATNIISETQGVVYTTQAKLDEMLAQLEQRKNPTPAGFSAQEFNVA